MSWKPERREPRRARYGSVERAVLAALDDFTDDPFGVEEAQLAVERKLDGPVNYGSVKASLAKLARGHGAPIGRVERGLYSRTDNGLSGRDC